MPKLFNMDIREVSIVDLPANKRKFVFMKKEGCVKKQSHREGERWETSEDTSDGHIHPVANLDPNGNGNTSPAGDPSHSHEIKEFMVMDITSGDYISRHPDQIMQKQFPEDEEEMPQDEEEQENGDELKNTSMALQIVEQLALLLSELKEQMSSEDEEMIPSAEMIEESEKLKSKEEGELSKEKEKEVASNEEESVDETEESEEAKSEAGSDEGDKSEEKVVFSHEEWDAFSGGLTELLSEVKDFVS